VATRRLLLVFGVAILVPAGALLLLGWRTLAQDRRNADLESRAQLDTLAARAASALDQDFARWQGLLNAVPSPCPASADGMHAPLRTALETPGAAVLVCTDGLETRAVPRRAVLCRPASRPADLPPQITPPEIESARRTELVREDYAAAAVEYKRLLAGASGATRGHVLLGLARTLDKGHRPDEAARWYAELEALGDVAIGSVPASLVGLERTCDLLARRIDREALAACATRLGDGLLESRWDIEEARYEDYMERSRAWLLQADPRSSPAGAGATNDLEARKRALTVAAAWAASSPSQAEAGSPQGAPRLAPGGRAVVISAAAAGAPATRLVLATSYLSDTSWARAFGDRSLGEVIVAVVAPNGDRPFVSGPTGPAFPSAAATAPLRDTGWHVQVAPRDPARASDAASRRRNVYLAMLALMGLSLAFGATLAVVTVRRERAVSILQSQFVSTVSHEFRSPLTAIQQLVELLARGRVAEESRQEYYDTLLRESHRLSRLVENVLDFSRIEDQRKPYRFEALEAAPFLQDVVNGFRQSPLAGHAAVNTQIAETLPRVRVDREAMTSALHNLLDNAVKYSAAPAVVEFQAEPCAQGVCIRVRDHGVGIPADEQAHVFERFFRGRDTSATVKGTGLGLSIVKHVVDAHGASIKVDSAPGAGTTVTVTLPPADAKE
jgi:signal transduction histidine kinase